MRKIRYCECGRELEYRCQMCSECRTVSDQINADIKRHTYKMKHPDKIKLQEKNSNAKRYEYKKQWDIKTGRRPRTRIQEAK